MMETYQDIIADIMMYKNKNAEHYVERTECESSIEQSFAVDMALDVARRVREAVAYDSENSDEILILSCGHVAVKQFGGEPVSYCPICGAKVVTDE